MSITAPHGRFAGSPPRATRRNLTITSMMVCSALLLTGCGKPIAEDIVNVVVKSPDDPTEDPTPMVSTKGFNYTKKKKKTYDRTPYQYTYVNLRDGKHVGSPNERDSRRGLSLIKLYIGHYAFLKGGEKEREQARRMLINDDNAIADELYSTYPSSISWVAKEYHLDSTMPDAYWGYSLTCSYDVAYFLAQLLNNEPDATILHIMQEQQTTLLAHTEQNFGTGVLPGVQGSRLTHNDDNNEFLSASFGPDFVAVGAINNNKETLTKMMKYQVLGEGTPIPKPTATTTTTVPTTTTSTKPTRTTTSKPKATTTTATATTTTKAAESTTNWRP